MTLEDFLKPNNNSNTLTFEENQNLLEDITTKHDDDILKLPNEKRSYLLNHLVDSWNLNTDNSRSIENSAVKRKIGNLIDKLQELQ